MGDEGPKFSKGNIGNSAAEMLTWGGFGGARFWGKNASGKGQVWEGTVDIGLKMGVACLEKCLEVVKFTKVDVKLTKNRGPAR